MKKFICVVFLLAMFSGCICPMCNNWNNNFVERLRQLDTAIGTGEYPTGWTNVCNGNSLCCEQSRLLALVQNELNKIKAAFFNFGNKVANVGHAWAKIQNIVEADYLVGSLTPDQAIDASTIADRSGATVEQFRAFSKYTAGQFVADFEAFKSQVPDCFNEYSTVVQRVSCDGCGWFATLPSRYMDQTGVYPTIKLTQASFDSWARKCNRVWNFMWKLSWFTQVVSYLNSKKGPYTSYSAPTPGVIYFRSSSFSIDAINFALANCGQATDAVLTTACTPVHKETLVSAFAQIFGSDSKGVGRADTSFIDSPYLANNGRRLLFMGTDGSISRDDTNGFDYSTSTQTIMASVYLTSSDIATWSHGYVASGSSSGSSQSSGGSSSSGTGVEVKGTLEFQAYSHKFSAVNAISAVSVIMMLHFM